MIKKERIKRILEQESQAIKCIPTNFLWESVSVMHERVHQHGGKIVVCGMGKAGQVGHNIATTFCSTGTPAVFLHPSEAQHGDLGIVQPNDVFLTLSNSGQTREVLEVIDLYKNLCTSPLVVSIVGNTNSELAKVSDLVIHTGGHHEICPLGLTPTTSTTTMMVIGDILVILMMELIGFTKEEYAKRHHGGYLGRAAKA